MMSIAKRIDELHYRIESTQAMLELFDETDFTYLNLKSHLDQLLAELEDLPQIGKEPKVALLFSGNAVCGSEGIKIQFASDVMSAFQGMLNIKTALMKNEKVAKRGKIKGSSNHELYLTSLPVGSFGLELSILDTEDLFAAENVSEAITSLMDDIEIIGTKSKLDQEVEKIHPRILGRLKTFLTTIAKEKSYLNIEASGRRINLRSSRIKKAADHLKEYEINEKNVFITGVFKGIVLNSCTFELLDETERQISGHAKPELGCEKLVEFIKYTNRECVCELLAIETIHKGKSSRIEYILQDVKLAN